MTERGVGRYPYLHRQTMLISIHHSACVLSAFILFTEELFEIWFELGVRRSLPSTYFFYHLAPSSSCFARLSVLLLGFKEYELLVNPDGDL